MTTANTRVAQILLKRGNTTQSGSYVGPLGEVTLDTDLDTLRIHDGSTPGGYSMLATKSDINQVNSDIGNISLGVVDTAPIIANVQAAVNSTINANVTAANAAIARLDANLGTATTNIAGLLSNAATQEGHITSLTASVVTLSTGISAMTANAAAQEVHINLLNANVTAANAAIASLQSQVYADANVAEYLLGTITTGNIIPQGNVIYTLGNASHQWRSLYSSSNTLFIGGQTLSVSDGQLSLNGNSIGGASTGHIGFEDNQIVNTNSIDESIVIMPGGMGYSAGETYIRLPGNADAATQPITIRNMIGNVAIGVASSATWLFNVEDQSLSLPHGWGENVSGSAKLSAPNGSITLTSSHGSDTNSFVFGANGNLTLPTIWDFTSSPAVQSSGIIFGDGTLQTTAYTGDNTEQGDPIALVDNVGQMPKAGSLWYNTDDG
jgi:hypothetical protein